MRDRSDDLVRERYLINLLGGALDECDPSSPQFWKQVFPESSPPASPMRTHSRVMSRRVGLQRLRVVVAKVHRSVRSQGVAATAALVLRRLGVQIEIRDRTDPRVWQGPAYRLESLRPITVTTFAERDVQDASPIEVDAVCTILNEIRTLNVLLESIDAQTVRPHRLVLVDGGSTDGTWQGILQWSSTRPWVIPVQAPGVNIAQGRNIGFSECTAQWVAFIDAGCRYDASYFERLGQVIKRAGAVSLVGMAYRPVTVSGASISALEPLSRDSDYWAKFLPSARGCAILRDCFEQVGGFPEWLTKTGEDTAFMVSIRDLGLPWAHFVESKIDWYAPSTRADLHAMDMSYATGDGESGVREGTFAVSRGKLLAQGHDGRLADEYAAYQLGFDRRAAIDVQRRGIEDVLVVCSLTPFADSGGAQRPAQMARFAARGGKRVVFLSAEPSYESAPAVWTGADLTRITLDFPDRIGVEALIESYVRQGAHLTFLFEAPHPRFERVLQMARMLPGTKIIYERIDPWEEGLGSPWWDPNVEQSFVLNAHVISVTSQGLRTGAFEDALLAQNAFDPALFAPSTPPRPKDLPDGKVAVYAGAVWGDWFDWESLLSACAQLSEWSFVLIGESPTHLPRALARIRNLYFLGGRAQTSLNAYYLHSTCGLIPFRSGTISAGVNPLKLHEYLAAGLPVVSSPLPDLQVSCPHISLYSPSEPQDLVRAIVQLEDRQSIDEHSEGCFVPSTWADVFETLGIR